MPHLAHIALQPDRYPRRDVYPFCLPIFQQTTRVDFPAVVTAFVGENGTGKSTLLRAMAERCGLPVWEPAPPARTTRNPYERTLPHYLEAGWAHGPVPGAFFTAQSFAHFAAMVEEFAAADPGQLAYFGGHSLLTLSHGQSLLSYFSTRFRIPGLYLLDEPEAALSPRSQLALLETIAREAAGGHAQFILCTHSPILMACPGAVLYSFDACPLAPVAYDAVAHVRLYREFLARPMGEPVS